MLVRNQTISVVSFPLCCAFVISLLIVCNTGIILLHIAAMILLCVVAIVEVKMDILHPYCWLSGFFCLYSISYPILISIGVPSNIGYTYESMVYQLVALFVVLLVITPQNHTKKINDINLQKEKYAINIGHYSLPIYYSMLFIIFIATVYVSKMGFSGKDDIYERGGSLLNAIFRLPLIISLFYTVLFCSIYSNSKKIPKKLLSFTFAALLAITLFSGERDFIFRFLLMNLFLFIFFNKISFKRLIVIVSIMAILVPFSHTFKYYFLRNEIAESPDYGFLASTLYGEFESATRNLQLLINNETTSMGCRSYGVLIDDVLGTFIPTIQSSVSWFDKTFYGNGSTQYGFSLVGEGYIIDGLTGVILIFLILGLITRYMYSKGFNSTYWISAYFYYITIIIYILRADLGTLFSAIIKQIFVILILIKLLIKIK